MSKSQVQYVYEFPSFGYGLPRPLLPRPLSPSTPTQSPSPQSLSLAYPPT